MLRGKYIVLGVTGSIAAYKIASLASMLKKKNADVTVIMTQNATNFINPITFESLTGNKCLVDTFGKAGGCGHGGAGFRKCTRQSRPRTGGRYADYDSACL